MGLWAGQVPSAAKDILTLYNNRSAMYEKSGQYEASLRDITVVLTMDAMHQKAKLRRARVYEALENIGNPYKTMFMLWLLNV